MPSCIILAGGRGKRMKSDKAFIKIGGQEIISIQIDLLSGIFDEILIVANRNQVEGFSVFERRGAKVVREIYEGIGPLGGIASGLALSSFEECFVLACDMPFIKRKAVEYVLGRLPGYMVSVPQTPSGLEPLHAAYSKGCLEVIREQMKSGNYKVTGFFQQVKVNYISWEEISSFDDTGMLLFNVNTPSDLRLARHHFEKQGSCAMS